jgi:uncharacterized BrkB/YihY/UPF0761 family membrane protein
VLFIVLVFCVVVFGGVRVVHLFSFLCCVFGGSVLFIVLVFCVVFLVVSVLFIFLVFYPPKTQHRKLKR